MSFIPHPASPKKSPEACPICSGTAASRYRAVDENHRISTVLFDYLQCQQCHSLFLSHPPTDMGRYYQSDYYAIPTLSQLEIIASKDQNKINTVLAHCPSGKLLEVGPAFGVFAWQAKQAGFDVDVIEMDAQCCEYIKNTLKIPVTQTTQPPDAIRALAQHDVIAIWHVLEHLPNVKNFLQAAAAKLKFGGVLVIAMPNPNAWQFQIMGKLWPHLDAPRHTTLVPEDALSRLAAQLGLEKVYFTSDDSDARSWNRFGWQRLLMNRFSNKWMQRAMFVLGYIVSVVVAPWDRRALNGSAYTVIYKKN